MSAPRPFPFLPTIDPLAYAHDHLAGLSLPKIVYRCVSRDSAGPTWRGGSADAGRRRRLGCWSARPAAASPASLACGRRTR